MDLSNPDGTGKLTITKMSIESDSVSFDYEGKVEGYGSVFDGTCETMYDFYKGVEEMMPKAFAVSAKSNDFDENGDEKTIDYSRMLKIVKSFGYTGYIGVEYEGNRLSEEDGIIATRDLLIKVGQSI